jgi:hypothetical protein
MQMNLPVPTPDAPNPGLTTPPDAMVEGLKEAMGLINDLIATLGPFPKSITGESHNVADGLRERFPHLDDLTLAAFSAYVAVNIIGTMASLPDAMCEHTIEWALTFGMQAKVLAWSLDTPEAPEVTR